MVICLDRGADLHMAQLIPLPLTVSCFSKIQIGLPFWYRLTQVVPDKGPLNGCVCVCVIGTGFYRLNVLADNSVSWLRKSWNLQFFHIHFKISIYYICM